MQLVSPDTYDFYTMASVPILLLVAYLVFGRAPRHFYTTLRDLTIIRKSELNRLRMEIAGLKSNIEMLQSAPIKKEADGQLRFDVPIESVRTVKKAYTHSDGTHWWQVWAVTDLKRWEDGQHLVLRDKKRQWVEELLKTDKELQPYRWEKRVSEANS